ncbi:hypothetical protein ACVW1C_005704 [Bradyrhizobium sp. USDA 4011]
MEKFVNIEDQASDLRRRLEQLESGIFRVGKIDDNGLPIDQTRYQIEFIKSVLDVI